MPAAVGLEGRPPPSTEGGLAKFGRLKMLYTSQRRVNRVRALIAKSLARAAPKCEKSTPRRAFRAGMPNVPWAGPVTGAGFSMYPDGVATYGLPPGTRFGRCVPRDCPPPRRLITGTVMTSPPLVTGLV